MYLLKFCKKEYNIKSNSQLRVGTLYDFRDIEQEEIRDGSEGFFDFQILFPEQIELDRRWANLLLNRAIGFGPIGEMPRFPGGFEASVEKMTLVKNTENGVIIRDAAIKIKRWVPNCLIFCMTLAETIELKVFEQYDDKWYIDFAKADRFARILANLIYNQSKLSRFSDIRDIHSPASLKGLSINFRHRDVKYMDRKLVVTAENMPKYDDLYQILIDIAFIKPPQFSGENEYRFCFDLYDGENIFPPTVKDMLLSLNPLLDL